MNHPYKQLTDAQRYQIEAYLKTGQSKEFIAISLGVSKTTIYREIKRNCNNRGVYSGSKAHKLAQERKERFDRNRKLTRDKLKIIHHYLEQEQWSPKQIEGYCKEHQIPMVSHERIYQYLRKNRQQGGDLYKNLRHRLKHRKRPVGKFIPIKNRVSISERPDIINNKERFGDWEIDTVIGKDHKGAIVTIVERTTNFFMMRKLDKGKDAVGLSQQVVDMLLPYKDSVLSITSDNGTEFAQHQYISKRLETAFYFANPYHSWERGLSEYTNKLVRQYICKKANFDDFTDQQIKDIQHKINRRPRQKLNYDNPKNLFYKLAS